ncbi:PASTA domain-containing protein [Promicromonospora citrea]|uniref:PASTA domain-containing protein n=1 Tax=Promicromonospora citrea TaxID=43677 RepID=A0A8H9L0H2_9MICO|nr:PASTA domain-containing protein [Promicromonospora citrea]NNH53052.1 PASTA domain-containing protein [Promicromonospora citrea]GGM11114.1 hypothetical protein GCM10010102_03710 [Promicromonospora citrea]
MSPDEQFAADLRDQVTRVAPTIAVDVTRVVPAARRRRVARAGGLTLAVALAAGGGTWAATGLTPRDTALPGGAATVVVSSPSPTPSGPPATSPEGDRLVDEPGNPVDGAVVPPADWRDASYLHVVVRASGGKEGEDGPDTPLRIERWYGDGVSFEHTASGPVPANLGPYLGMEGEQPISLTWAEVAALPTEPAALHDALVGTYESTGVAQDAALLAAGRLLTDTPAPPDVRAAAWELLTSSPRVEVTAGVEDSEGREGTAATYVLFDRTTTLVYDEAGNRPLQLESAIGKMHSVDVYLTNELAQLPEAVADAVPTVPDLVAGTVDDAAVACAREELTCLAVDVPSDTVPPGAVVATEPAAGALVDRGSVVTLHVSTGP